ncbi:MAG: TetR/AcrR family transcriptional regulator [Anaerolineae bacterium]
MTEKILSKREQLLLAASQIVMEKGAAQLTLDAVAALAGVSKGGLLYHFPSKEALITGMIAHYLDTFEAHITRVYAALPAEPGRWLRAYVCASFDHDDTSPTLISAGLAAVVNQPDLLEAIQQQYTQWTIRALDDGVAPEIVHIVMAATDGVWFGQALGVPQMAIKESLLQLISRGSL